MNTLCPPEQSGLWEALFDERSDGLTCEEFCGSSDDTDMTEADDVAMLWETM